MVSGILLYTATVNTFMMMTIIICYPFIGTFMRTNISAIGAFSVNEIMRAFIFTVGALIIFIVVSAGVTANLTCSVIPLMKSFIKMQSASV